MYCTIMQLELLLFAAFVFSLGFATVVVAQRPQHPLDGALSLMFDSNKDGVISMPEVTRTLDNIAVMYSDLTPDASDQTIANKNMVEAAMNVAPTIFEFLDSDSSHAVSRNELKWVQTIHSGFLNDAIRSLTREVFAAMNTNGDDFLDTLELDTAASTDSKVFSTIVGLVHEAYPYWKNNVDAWKPMVQQGLSALRTSNGSKASSEELCYIDTNKDGKISNKETVKAYLDFKTKFLQAATNIVANGPMMARMSSEMMGDTDGDL